MPCTMQHHAHHDTQCMKCLLHPHLPELEPFIFIQLRVCSCLAAQHAAHDLQRQGQAATCAEDAFFKGLNGSWEVAVIGHVRALAQQLPCNVVIQRPVKVVV